MKIKGEILSWRTSFVEVMQIGKMGVKYVKDGDFCWTPVVRKRRKKSVRSQKSEISGNLM